jgi:hypothetical protein
MKAVINGWVHLDTHSRSDEEEPRFAFFGFQATHKQGYTPLFEHTIEVELPADFRGVAVEAELEAIKAQMAQAAADYHATVKTLQERLSKLQAIEYVGVA